MDGENAKEVNQPMEQELDHRQGLTPVQQKTLRLLQMNNLQLRDYLEELMTSNAVIELEYPRNDYHPGPFNRLTGQRRSETVYDPDSEPDPDAGRNKDQMLENRAAGVSPLHDLFLQSASLGLSRPQQRILSYLIQSLDENGFLKETDQMLAASLNAPVDAVRQCVQILQQMEPAGVGASGFQDSLRLQLLRQETPDAIALQIVESHLPEMAKQAYDSMAKALQVPKERILEACKCIRTLNPKPLNGQNSEAVTQYVIPDFYVIEEDGRLSCFMNDSFLPQIRIDPTYPNLLRDASLAPSDREYIQNSCQQAQESIDALTYRKATLQRVAEYILSAQAEFFRKGPGSRAAMTHREIARALALHESTVSRAANGKFLECKWGVFPVKSLFVRKVSQWESDSVSVDRLLKALRTLVDSEPQGAAYSDQKLASLLTAQGFRTARRTIAHYRQMLGIPSASQRGGNP